MAVIRFNWSPDARSGTWGEKNSREYERRATITTNSRNDDPPTIFAACADIPRIGASHPNDSGAKVKSIRLSPLQGDPQKWELVVTYSHTVDDQDQVNPLLRPPKIKVRTHKVEVAVGRAYDGVDAEGNPKYKPIQSSAYEPFEDPLMQEVSRLVMTYTRNERTYNPSLIMSMIDCVNSDAFWFADPGQALFYEHDAEEVIEAGNVFWTHTYEIHFARESFKRFVLDQGFRVLVESAGPGGLPGRPNKWDRRIKACAAVDDDGNPVSKPIRLNGKGKRLDETAEPVYLEFDTREKVAFSRLRLTRGRVVA